MEMQPLDRKLRGKLERTVIEARAVVEEAARAALEQIGVGDGTAMSHLSDEDRALRRKLRAHGRQLGDNRDSKTGKQEVELLVEEVAYQHWHRMLFARFLAENNLLMYPHSNNPVPVTLEECEELAPDEGAKNGWELASRYAARMLPQIFRITSPVFQLTLPPEHQQKLEQLIEDLPGEVYTASDSLGWVYQFWQTKKKEEVNISGVKIGRRELPAVTQLFTEPYMVAFLLDNSLGAWWVGKCLTGDDLRNADSEEELRKKAALPGMPLEYLRFVKGDDGAWKPAAGTFEAWPDSLQDFKALDPCCGSGHFLVVMFMMLVAIRIEMEKLSPRDAVDVVLKENLHGLELDQRCVELAAFAVAFAAWKYPNAGGYRPLPDLNIACSGLALNVSKETWQQVAARVADKIIRKDNDELFPGEEDASLWHTRLIEGMNALYDLFQNAPVLGSLIQPETIKSDILQADFEQTKILLEQVLKIEKNINYGREEEIETAVTAHGLSHAAKLLIKNYYLVITNPPYLARGGHEALLANFGERYFPLSKNDLAMMFLERNLKFLETGGISQLVLPQNLLFSSAYSRLRQKILKYDSIKFIAHIGEKGFDSSHAAGAFVILLSLSSGNYHYDEIYTLDATSSLTPLEKSVQIKKGALEVIYQSHQLKNNSFRISVNKTQETVKLNKYAVFNNGICSGDYSRFGRLFWELNNHNGWVLQQSTVDKTTYYGGREHILLWENGKGALYNFVKERLGEKGIKSWIRGLECWEKKGVAISPTRTIRSTIYTGESFDDNTLVLIPHKEELIGEIWEYCSSDQYHYDVRKIDRALKVRGALVEVPFDFEHWSSLVKEKYPNGIPKPFSDDPTQWIFHGHPCGSVVWNESTKQLEQGELRVDPTVLQVAVARMLGYRWPAELDPEMELSEESREWIKESAELLGFADEDGIVCIPPVRGEPSARDRLLNLLSAAYGDAWSNDIRIDLLKSVDHEGKTLETWLRDKFFIQHCQLFHHRPFIWHIWDGLPGGFSVLVNYHKLDHKNLETLIYTYLGDWISRQKQDQAAGIDGAGEKLAAAENLKKRLELILEGEEPYDIFVRWKPIEEQPIGWEPDLNDGVRLNIRPFMSVPDIRKKGAGVLRDKPNIKWTKDRGKDVESAPWYHLFKGERINDHHLSLEEKRAARKEKIENK